jgi:type IV pilus modification protein PilV
MITETASYRCHKNEEGFTLIEVLIALTIFSIGILAVGNMQLNATSGNRKAQSVTYSANWAVDRIEWLLASGSDSVAAYDAITTAAPAADADGIDNNYNGQVDEAGEAGPLSISWTVVEENPGSGEVYDYKVIAVTVTETRGAEARSVTVQDVLPKII